MMKLRATKDLRYATRSMRAGDEFDATDVDARYLMAIEDAEDAAQREPSRRGRPAKAAAEANDESAPDPTPASEPEPEAPEPTHAELLALAEERGIDLPAGYVRKERLVELLEAEGPAR